MALKGHGKRTISRGMEAREPFDAGSVTGRHYASMADVPLGRLPLDVSKEDKRGGVYVVFSYRTPIAWSFDQHEGNVWIIPDVKYSVTTSNHQTVVNVCADNPGFYNDARW